MNWFEKIVSNIHPIVYNDFYLARKRIFHKGYEIYVQCENELIHLRYTEEL